MRIAIDGTTLRARDGRPGAGIEHYTRMISSAMVGVAEGCEVRVVSPIGRIPFVSRHLSVPLQARIFGADVLFCPSGHIPLGWTGKAVITVHDLAIYEHPEWFPGAGSPLDARSIRRAEAIIAVSEATREQIGRMFPGAAARTVVAYPGVRTEGAAAARGSDDSQEIVLFVGTIEPRKNLVNALAAFDAFLRVHPDRATSARFLLAGSTGWKAEPILEAISEMNAAWRKKAGGEVVQHLGYVPESEKWELYARASCFFFPSLYEGFGLPVLEAMTAGTPIVTSNRGALPEVGGDAVIYVEPEDVEQMALAIAQCLMMPEAMEEMIAGAKARAREFSWERSARGIVETILKVL